MDKILNVAELIEILLLEDQTLPVVMSHDGKGHTFGITEENIGELDTAYSPNDEFDFPEGQKFLQIGLH